MTNDKVSFANTSAAFDTKNVGTGKTVSVSGIAISGDDAGNYSLQNTTASATADVTAKVLTASYTASNKVYDGGTTASVTGASGDIVTNDKVSFANTSATFDTKNVGTGKTVSVSGIAISGDDAGNYSLQNTTASTVADISKRTVSLLGITAADKTYDGTSMAVVSTTGAAFSDKVTGDDLTVSSSQGTFSDKMAGQGKAVSLVTVLGGSDLGNYNVTLQTNTTANIKQAPLDVTAIAVTKTYDGQLSAAGVGMVGALAAQGDRIASSGMLSFADKNAGSNKTILASGVSIKDADNADMTANYNIRYVNSSQGVITPAALSIVGTQASDKNYDGNSNASVKAGTISGFVGDENLTVASVTGQFESAEPGVRKAVTAVYRLADGANGGQPSNYAWSPVNVTAQIFYPSKETRVEPYIPVLPASYSRISYVGFTSKTGAVIPASQDQCSAASIEQCICKRREGQPLEVCIEP